MKQILCTSLFGLLFLMSHAQSSLTVSVDMNQYFGAFETVYVSGSFNGWGGDSNPMSDDDGDGVWTATLDLEDGPYEYKFQVNQWQDDETLTEGTDCTLTTSGYTNRFIEVVGATEVPTVCWAACSACAPLVEGNVTVSVDMNQYTGDAFDVVTVFGAFNGWSIDANPLADDDGDGVWTGTVLMPAGANEYKFALGTDGSDESLEAGSSCTITTGEFTNRLIMVDGDATIDAVCFNSCTACMNFVDGNITVSVDMNQYTGDAFDVVTVFGAFNGWSIDANPLADDDGDGVWTGTVLMPAGANEYKFALGTNGSDESLEAGSSCTITTGEFTNRLIMVDGDATIDAVCFGSCSVCAGDDGCVTFEDYEGGGDTLFFSYFGSTLEPGTTNVIANPNASGVNTSASVGEYTKAANSQSWAGCAADVPMPIDVILGEQICIKVHYPATGNLALKLENSTTGAEDWILKLPVETANEWVELCYDTNLPSEEGSMLPAAGSTYGKLVLFFDFDIVYEEDITYYFDDIKVCGAVAPEPVDVTFQVNMSEYDGTATNVLLRGGFNGWDESTPMTDMGDGTFAVTLSLQPGAHEYKYYVQDGDDWEQFSPYEECVLTTGDNTNRQVVITEPTVLENVCFNSCYACGESVDIEINVATSEIEVALDGIFLAGGEAFGAPGRYNLTDPDGDGVHSIAFSRRVGFSSYYTFTNGACQDFSCKEDIAGQDCADPDSFNDRFMDGSTDVTVNTCFGECATTAECMGNGLADGDVTFTVNMSQYLGDFTTVYVFGSFNGWSGDANPLEDMGSGIWSTTIPLAGGNVEYKFAIENLTDQEQFAGGEDCTITTGGYTNRLIVVDGDADLGTVCFNSCTDCMVNVNDLTIDNNMFTVIPTLVKNDAFIQFNASAATTDKVLKVYNAIGELMMTQTLETFQNEYHLNTSDFANGVYFINVTTDSKLGTQRIIVNK